MRALAAAPVELAALLQAGAAHAAQALAGLVGGEARAGALVEPGSLRLAGGETGVAFDVDGAFTATVVVLFASPGRERLLARLGRAAERDPRSALSEVANILASQAVSAIADALGAPVALSVPRLSERAGGLGLARALRSGATALASELDAGRAGVRAVLVLLPGGRPRSAIP